MVLDDVTEYEITTDGVKQIKLEQLLLNGNNVCLVRTYYPPLNHYNSLNNNNSWFQVDHHHRKI